MFFYFLFQPFYQGGQQQGIRQRYPGNVQNTQSQTLYPATGGNQVVFINSPPQFSNQPIVMGMVSIELVLIWLNVR